MKMLYSRLSAFFLFSLISLASTQSPCSNSLTPTYNTPALAAGWQATLIARGLSRPRSIVLDSLGHLLVLQQGVGIVNLQFNDAGGTCLSLVKQTTVISSSDVGYNPLFFSPFRLFPFPIISFLHCSYRKARKADLPTSSIMASKSHQMAERSMPPPSTPSSPGPMISIP